jgi:predicted DCC family thiol-disulfide oxidoreductase YuxK
LCHGFVRFVLAEDPSGKSFDFSPLQGRMFLLAVSETERAALPDSIVVRDGDGRLLFRSEAVLEVLRRLGGVWRMVGACVGLLPRGFLDAVYDRVAGVRGKLFRKPPEACPLVPPELQGRFRR